MALYRFIGDSALLHDDGKDLYFSTFGQSVELADEQARVELGRRIPLIPDADFQKIGFTPEELKLYPTAATQRRAPESFRAKKEAAISVFLDEIAHVFTSPSGVKPLTEEPTANA